MTEAFKEYQQRQRELEKRLQAIRLQQIAQSLRPHNTPQWYELSLYLREWFFKYRDENECVYPDAEMLLADMKARWPGCDYNLVDFIVMLHQHYDYKWGIGVVFHRQDIFAPYARANSWDELDQAKQVAQRLYNKNYMQIDESQIKQAAAEHADRKASEVKAEVISDFETGMRAALSIKTSLAGYGSYLIELERLSHLEKGYDPTHDDQEDKQQLAIAAAVYAAEGTALDPYLTHPGLWPWNDETRPDRRGNVDRKRQLVIAGALIAAEIDRLLRIEQRESGMEAPAV